MELREVEPLFARRTIRVTATNGVENSYGYRLLEPPASTTAERYPLVLYLHGAGERGDDNRAQLRYLPTWMCQPENRQRFACFLVAPQCREHTYWVETPRATDPQAPRAAPGPMMQMVIAILDEVCAQWPVDPRRLYLTGLSMGGFGSWDLGTRLAERWAAVAPICGGGDELYAHRLAGVPAWAWHGDQDDVVPVSRSRVMIEAIRAAGGTPRYTELAGVGHDSWTPAYTREDGLLPWMFAQRRDE